MNIRVGLEVDCERNLGYEDTEILSGSVAVDGFERANMVV